MHLEVAWAANVTDAVPSSSWAGHELEDTILYGSNGTLRYEPASLFTMDGTERKVEALHLGPDRNAFETQLADFVRAAQAGIEPTNGINQAITLMEMLTAIYRSSDEGKEIRLA